MNKQALLIGVGLLAVLMLAKPRTAQARPAVQGVQPRATNTNPEFWLRQGLDSVVRGLSGGGGARVSTSSGSQSLLGRDWWRQSDPVTGGVVRAETDLAGLGFDPTASGPGLSTDPSRYGVGVRYGSSDLAGWLNLQNDTPARNWTLGGVGGGATTSGGGGGLRSSSMYGLRVSEADAFPAIPMMDYQTADTATAFFNGSEGFDSSAFYFA